MKICFLGLENLPVLAPEFNHHGIGGEEVQHTLLAKSLARRGHHVSMVVYDYGQQDRAHWDRVTTYKAYRASAGIPVVRFVHPRWTGVWQALRRADADLYYVSCAGMHLGLVALFCRMYRRKWVFRVAHDTDCEPDKLLVQFWRDKKLYEYGLRRSPAILVQTQRQQQAILTNYGLASMQVGMLVDFPQQRYTFEERDVDVLWVNNLRQFKRPDLFLALARRSPHLQFHMVGGPQPGFESMFEAIRREAESIANLTFHGRVAYHAMDRKYDRARVFVNTSDSEGFPNAFLQAWVRGTPVVSFFDPDHLIEQESLGKVVNSLDTMTHAIETLFYDTLQWTQASNRCVAYMERVFSEDRILAPYLSIFGAAA